MLESVNRYDFEKKVLKSRRPVLVNFWVDGNEGCQKMRKLMRNLDEHSESNLRIVEINWEMERELAQRYRVFGTPCLLIFNEGKLLDRYSGTLNLEEFSLKSWFEFLRPVFR